MTNKADMCSFFSLTTLSCTSFLMTLINKVFLLDALRKSLIYFLLERGDLEKIAHKTSGVEFRCTICLLRLRKEMENDGGQHGKFRYVLVAAVLY